MSNTASEPVNPSSDVQSLLTGNILPFVVSHIGSPKLAKWISRGIAAYTVLKWVQRLAKKQPLPPNVTQIAVFSNQRMYDWIHYWISRQEVAYEGHDFSVGFVQEEHPRPSRSQIAVASGAPRLENNEPQKPHFFPLGAFTVIWNGIRISFEKSSRQASDEDKAEVKYSYDRMVITVETRDKAKLTELFSEIRAVGTDQGQQEPPWVYIWNYHWVRIRHCPQEKRVVLPGDTYENLKLDLENFLERQEWYESVGIPWRRGYLLHGEPGSGKGTTVQTLAGALGLDIHCLSLKGISDQGLLSAITDVSRRSIILIEDVDCAFDGREAADGETRLTMSGLLNALDGVATPDGRVVFMTTNHVEKLDAALIRPGRIDVKVQFHHATAEQIQRLAARFEIPASVGEGLADQWEKEGITMATAQVRLIELSPLTKGIQK